MKKKGKKKILLITVVALVIIAWATAPSMAKSSKKAKKVEDFEGNQVQLYAGHGTKQIRGNKKVGDTVRAEITRGGFANSIQ